MYITDNSVDPAGKFEDLVRFTFDNCSKYGDPWGYAAQEVHATFIGGMDLKGRRILSTILVILIYRYNKTGIKERLKQLEENVWKATTQEDGIEIIIQTIKLLESLPD